jgi:hypothetical protein
MLLVCPAVSQIASSPTCVPLSLPVGSQAEVIAKSATFLTKGETIQAHPYWPGGISGVTVGIGWDLGYHSISELHRVWAALGTAALQRLDTAAGKKGEAAHGVITQLKYASEQAQG